MFSFFKSKTDLNNINKLEKAIGKEIPALLEQDLSVLGYTQNEEGHVVFLNLCQCELTALPPIITDLEYLTTLSISNNQLTELPPEIQKLENLSILSLSQNKLTELPPEIANLEKLTHLDVATNQLSALPKDIGRLTKLNELVLEDNRFNAFPTEIAHFSNLKILNLGKNQLICLPPEIGQLETLSNLFLNDNELTELAPAIAQLNNLTTLSLSNNKISKIPPEIAHLKILEAFDLTGNQLSGLPNEITQLKALKRFSLAGNQLTEFPQILLDLNLEIQMGCYSSESKSGLYINNNPFERPTLDVVEKGRNAIAEYYRSRDAAQTEMLKNIQKTKPETQQTKNSIDSAPKLETDLDIIARLERIAGKKFERLGHRNDYYQSLGYVRNRHKQVTFLGLDECDDLEDLLPEVIKLTNLTRLDIISSSLTELPIEIANLQRLSKLALRDNSLSKLPDELGSMQNLSVLDLYRNQFSKLPQPIFELKNLTVLNISSNKIKEIPPEIENLCNLTTFNISSNRLTALPAQIAKLQALKEIDLDYNSMQQLAPEIGELKNLKKLLLGSNSLSTLPTAISELKSLITLKLRGNQLNKFPAVIANLENLKELDLSISQLSYVTSEIGNLRNLNELDLSYNEFRKLPTEIGNLQCLTQLNLARNKLTELPAEIGQLESLIELDIAKNKLSKLPIEIGYLKSLDELDINTNELTKIPAEIGELKNLTTLNLSNNEIDELPAELGNLENLTQLNLNQNKLSQLGFAINKLKNLYKVNLADNQLTELPAEMKKLRELQNLNLANNQLAEFTPALLDVRLKVMWDDEDYMEGIHVKGNPFEIPPVDTVKKGKKAINRYYAEYKKQNNLDLGIIKKLEQILGKQFKEYGSEDKDDSNYYTQNPSGQVTHLGLYDCSDLEALPVEIFNLKNLIGFALCRSKISGLPAEIAKLDKLVVLNIFQTQLTSLPAEIGNLKNLKILNLRENKLSKLAPEVSQLSNIGLIDLTGNQFTQFPVELLSLNLDINWDVDIDKLFPNAKLVSSNNLEGILSPFLTGIHVKDNPFATPPVEIVKQGKQAINDYYSALETQSAHEEPAQAKPETIQTSSTAPTSSSHSLQRHPISKPQPLNEAKLILIGDGGAGKTSVMKCLLGKDYDPQEPQTHGVNINTLALQYQANAIKLHCWDFGGQQIMHTTHQFFLSKRSLYLLVLDSRRETQVDYWLRHIQAFAQNAPVIIVINKIDENPHFDLPKRQLKKEYSNIKQVCRLSCATREGLDSLHEAIQATLPDIELLDTVFPANWLNVKVAITEQAQIDHYASYQDYISLCQAYGITTENEQNTLINFLHDLGLVIHFPDRWLRETNVINPQWLTEAVYSVINAPQLAGNGKLHRNQLSGLLDNHVYPVHKHDYILELMVKFELCYALNEHEYLFPDLFPSHEPDFEFDDTQTVNFIFKYSFLPKSIFTRFVVKMHQDIHDNIYWRNGVLFYNTRYNSKALVEVDRQNSGLSVFVSGQEPREYLAVLRFMLNDIHHSFGHLKVVEHIGLPDNLSVNYDYLCTLAKQGQIAYIPPENPTQNYNIAQLLDSIAPRHIDKDESADVEEN